MRRKTTPACLQGMGPGVVHEDVARSTKAELYTWLP